jgi:hypothetical protein
MPQYFSKNANTLARFSLLAVVTVVIVVAWGGAMIVRSPYESLQEVPREQPVPFSHEHHVGGLGIDCRYCHTTVEYSSFANIPPTKVCRNCHSQMWAVSPELEPVRESYRTGPLHRLDARPRLTRVCLFQSQYSREQRRGLLIMSWTRGQNAAYVAGKVPHHGVVS